MDTHYVNDNAFRLPFGKLCKEFKSIEEVEQFTWSRDLRNGILKYNAKVYNPKVEFLDSILCMTCMTSR